MMLKSIACLVIAFLFIGMTCNLINAVPVMSHHACHEGGKSPRSKTEAQFCCQHSGVLVSKCALPANEAPLQLWIRTMSSPSSVISPEFSFKPPKTLSELSTYRV